MSNTPNEENMPKKAPASAEGAAAKPEGQAAPKKKKIIAVFNSHNSQTGIRDPRSDKKNAGGRQQGGRNGEGQARRQGGANAASNTNVRSTQGRVYPRTAPSAAPTVNILPNTQNTRPARPAAETKAPAAEEVKVQTAPAAEVKAPAAETKAPAAEVKAPAPETKAPAAEVKAPAAEAETQAAPQREARPARAPRDGQGQRAPRDGQSQRPYNRDGQGQRAPRDGQGQRPYNRDGQDGQRSYNRDGQGQRPYNRDGQGQRPYNRDGQDGQRPYNRDGQGQRPFGRDGQGQRPYNRDGQGQRPYNRDNQGGFHKDFDKDKDADTARRPQSQSRRSSGRNDMAAASMVDTRKSENRRVENKNRDDRKDRAKFSDDYGTGRQGGRSQGAKNNTKKKGAFIQPAPVVAPKKEEGPKEIAIPETISIGDLAEKMKVQPSVLVKKLFLAGKMVTVNSELDFEQAGELAMEMNFDPVPEEKEDVIAKLLEDTEDAEEDLVTRAPVVCVMGHVDHGKTSLLDAIRNSHVTDREAGGITQHIGASVVEINGEKITFLDTPGHEAFTAMRMRGANSTDIAILVVAADDGVKPQTIEAINHAKAAGVEIIVAINKIDKPAANPERVKQELMEFGLVAEEWGGSTICVPVSAKSHEGIDTLLEMILLTAEVLELKANPKRAARGIVIEAELDKGKGSVATVLVQKGTLHVGDPIAVGGCYGKIRAMMDDKGRRVKEAGPSKPVEILGLSDVPQAGDTFISPSSEKDARAFAETYIKESREKLIEDTKLKMSLDDLYSQIQAGSLKELNIIVKADVQGSVEAVKASLLKLSNEEVVVKVVHSGVGAINESDIVLASASSAIVIGFNVRPDTTAKETAEREKVDIRLYRVIYDAINDVEAAMKGMLDPIFEEKILGHAEVRQLFKASGVGTIAGSYVLDGIFQRGCSVRITREGTQIFEGALASLKRFKDDVKEVRSGFECGLVFEKFNDLQELDIVEAYTMVEVPR